MPCFVCTFQNRMSIGDICYITYGLLVLEILIKPRTRPNWSGGRLDHSSSGRVRRVARPLKRDTRFMPLGT